MENEIKSKPEGDVILPSADVLPKKPKKIVLIIVTLIILIAIGGAIYWQSNINAPREIINNDLIEKIKQEQGKVSFKDLMNNCKNIEEPFRESCIQSTCDAVGTIQEKINRCLAMDTVTFDEKRIYEMKDQCLNFISFGSSKPMEVCDAMHSGSYNKDFCYLNIAQETGDKSACDKMESDIPRKNLCYEKVARIKKDPEICKGIDLDYYENWCSKDSSKNDVYCIFDHDIYNTKEYKNWCLAVATGDLSKCDSMDGSESSANDGNIKGNCYSEIAEDKNDSSICEKIDWDDYSKENCYSNLSISKKDTSLCDSLEESRKSNCYLTIEIQKAVEKGDDSICEREDIKDKDNCYYEFITEKKDISFCEKLSADQDARYYCYSFLPILAAEELNQNLNQEEKSLYNEYCKIAEDETKREEKIIEEAKEIIKTTRDINKAVAKCKEISAEESKESYVYCIAEIAIESKDALICKENINTENTTGYFLELCLAPLVMNLNDISICELIPTQGGRNECYIALAVKNNDPKICDSVEVIKIGNSGATDETNTKEKCINFNIGKDIIPQKYEKYR